MRRYALILCLFCVVFAWTLSLHRERNVREPSRRTEVVTVQHIRYRLYETEYEAPPVLLRVKNADRHNPNGLSSVQTGDRLRVEGRFEDVFSLENRGYARYLAAKGIRFLVNGDAKKLGDHDVWLRLRAGLLSRIDRRINERYRAHGSLVKALLYGDRSELSKAMEQDFIRTGAVHLLSLSGFHIGWIATILMSLLRGLPYLHRRILSLALLALYCALCAWIPTLFRAYLFFVVAFSAFVSERRFDLITTCFLSASLLLLTEVHLVLDVSFQLSFLSVLSLAMFYPIAWRPCKEYMDRWEERLERKNGSWKAVSEAALIGSRVLLSSLLVGITVQILILPVLLLHFGGFSVLSFVTNLLVVPLFSVLMLCYLLSLVTAFVPPLSSLFVASAISLEEAVLFINGSFADLPFAVMTVEQVSPLSILIYGILVLLFYEAYVWMERKRSKADGSGKEEAYER